MKTKTLLLSISFLTLLVFDKAVSQEQIQKGLINHFDLRANEVTDQPTPFTITEYGGVSVSARSIVRFSRQEIEVVFRQKENRINPLHIKLDKEVPGMAFSLTDLLCISDGKTITKSPLQLHIQGINRSGQVFYPQILSNNYHIHQTEGTLTFQQITNHDILFLFKSPIQEIQIRPIGGDQNMLRFHLSELWELNPIDLLPDFNENLFHDYCGRTEVGVLLDMSGSVDEEEMWMMKKRIIEGLGYLLEDKSDIGINLMEFKDGANSYLTIERLTTEALGEQGQVAKYFDQKIAEISSRKSNEGGLTNWAAGLEVAVQKKGRAALDYLFILSDQLPNLSLQLQSGSKPAILSCLKSIHDLKNQGTQIKVLSMYDHVNAFAKQFLHYSSEENDLQSIRLDSPDFSKEFKKLYKHCDEKSYPEGLHKYRMSVSPNPAINKLHVYFEQYIDELQNKRLMITDLSGQRVLPVIESHYSQEVIDLSILSAAPYYIHLYSGDQLIETKKFIVIKP